MTSLKSKLEELDRLEKKATPGEWFNNKDYRVITFKSSDVERYLGKAATIRDRDFIAASRNAYPDLSEFFWKVVKLLEHTAICEGLESPPVAMGSDYPVGCRKCGEARALLAKFNGEV